MKSLDSHQLGIQGTRIHEELLLQRPSMVNYVDSPLLPRRVVFWLRRAATRKHFC